MTTAMLPILMYHGLHADASRHGHFDTVYSVHPEDFAQQLDWLVAHGYRSVRLRDLDSVGATRCVVISFDDGDASNVEVALPELRKRRFVAEFFVTTDFIDARARLSASDLRALCRAGMGIQSHGASHRYLDELAEVDLLAELVKSKRQLEAITGETVLALALPGGRGAQRERLAALQAGYREVLNSAPGCNSERMPGEYLQRLPVTRGLSIAAFAGRVQGHGALPRLLQTRYRVLAQVKHLLGTVRYERLRSQVLRP